MAVAIAAIAISCLTGVDARALDPNRNIVQFIHSGWTARDGLPPVVNAIAQTPDGYLWLGTQSGLYRFDGVRFQAVGRRSVVQALTVTPPGDLWIGRVTGVERLSPGARAPVAAPPFGPVRLMASDRKGAVWVATDSQVARFDGRQWQVEQSDWGSSDGWTKPTGIWALSVARDGTVWAKNQLALYDLRPGATRFEKADGYAGGMINFARAADGRLWTADTLFKRFYALPDLGPSGPAPSPAQIGNPIPVGVLTWVIFDRDGTLWCANQATGGVYRVRGVAGPVAPTESFLAKDGLTSMGARSIFEDTEGDVWVGTYRGLDRFSPANVATEQTISIRAQLENITSSPAAVYVADGWASPDTRFGHPAETAYRIAAGAPQILPIPKGDIGAFQAMADDTLLVGVGPRLLRRRSGVISDIALPAAARDARVLSALETGSDLWVMLSDKGVFRLRNDVWTSVPTTGLVLSNLATMRAEPSGAVWLFPDIGPIERVMGDRTRAYQGAEGPNLGQIFAFAPDPAGALFGGQFGVARFDGRSFHTITEHQAPWLTWVTGIVSDDVGGTWFNTLSGVYRVATRQLDEALRNSAVRLDGQLFDGRDGLKTTATLDRIGNTAVRSPDGRLGFMTQETVAWIDPHHLNRNLVPPPVGVQSVTTRGRVLDLAAARTLAAGTSELQIDYTALSLQNPERVRFRYQLEGVDRGWVDAGARRQAFYTRLGPGHFRFHVIAANNDGVWNRTGATYQFAIPPTFIQSGWFLLLCAILAALLLWAAYAWRVRQVTAAIKSRLEERVAERERIARELHDTLLQGFQGLILRLHAVTHGLPRASAGRVEMESVLERADEILISGRDRVRQLRDQDHGDLTDALVAAAEAASDKSRAEFRLTVEGGSRALHSIITEEFAAIGREAIFNAFRHGGAKTIDAVVTFDRRALSMRIADDGVGIDPGVLAQGGRAGHFGLTGMRERAEKVRARFAISSRPGAGCEVTVVAPAHIAYAASSDEPWLRRWLRAVLRRAALLIGAPRSA
jgi:signal transduction histidine kinase/ligand-binding sensor domain-containing protein